MISVDNKVHGGRDTTTELAWLAGLLEGDGCFFVRKQAQYPAGYPGIQLYMTDRDTVARAAEIMGAPSVRSYQPEAPRKDGYSRKQSWVCSIFSRQAIEICTAIWPLMSDRRKEKITEMLTAFRKNQKLGER